MMKNNIKIQITLSTTSLDQGAFFIPFLTAVLTILICDSELLSSMNNGSLWKSHFSKSHEVPCSFLRDALACYYRLGDKDTQKSILEEFGHSISTINALKGPCSLKVQQITIPRLSVGFCMVTNWRSTDSASILSLRGLPFCLDLFISPSFSWKDLICWINHLHKLTMMSPVDHKLRVHHICKDITSMYTHSLKFWETCSLL